MGGPNGDPADGRGDSVWRLDRPDLTERSDEAWRPPLFVRATTPRERAGAAARRLFDLQAASIWRDLSKVLPHAEGLVVDVGCGAQPYRALVGPHARYLGIDTVAAKDAFGYDSEDTIYFSGSSWPVETGAADVVLSTETLEHVLDPHVFIAECRRCLKRGGRLVLTVPFAARWHFVPHDYWRYTPSSLAALLTESGFSEVSVYARGNATTVACYKTLALFLPLLLPRQPGRLAQLWRALALLSLPLLVALAVVGHVTLGASGGDDCLGYTVIAV